MVGQITETEWQMLLRRIEEGRCTPFLGAGASYPALSLGSQIARRWAEQYDYPFDDRDNLVTVSQFVAINYDSVWPKEVLQEEIARCEAPDFREPDEPHGVLAELPLPVFMTTNYDDFMYGAFRMLRNPKDARRAVCRWNSAMLPDTSGLETGFQPTVAQPLIFHLHGHTDPASLVLTENDYLDFLAEMARNPDIIPPVIRQRLQNTAFLFLGYRLGDWNFRVLFQTLRTAHPPMSVLVMPLPKGDRTEAQRTYLEHYYAAMNLKIYWGTARQFCAELNQRREAAFNGAEPQGR